MFPLLRKKSLYSGTHYFLLLCIPVVVGMYVLRNFIVNVLATPDYYERANAIPQVVLGGLFSGLQQ